MIGNVKKQNTQHFVRNHYALFIGLSILVMVVFLLTLGTRPRYIGSNFSYSSNLALTFSRYDSAHDRYDGEQYASGSFFVQRSGTSKGNALLKETLSATSLQTNSTLTLSSIDLAANAESGEVTNAPGAGQPYVFAPRNLKPKQTFSFWYAPYARSAVMRYDGTEDLFGLQVYRYSADFSKSGTLPAANIYNENLPNGQSLQYKPQMHVWIEPTTGWLLKYTENTTAYFYDTTTGVTFKPAYSYTNITTDESVSQQVAYAQALKLQLSIAREVLPAILLLIALTVLASLAMRMARVTVVPMQITLGFIFAAGLGSLIGWWLNIDMLKGLFTGVVPINPLVSVCFILSAVAMLLLYRRMLHKTTIILATLVAVMSLMQMLTLLNMSPLDLDLVMFRNEALSYNSTMSLLSAFMFFILSIGILKTLLLTRGVTLRFSRIAASIVVTLASVSLLAKILILDRAFSVTLIESISVSELALFLVAGYAFFKVMQARHGHRIEPAFVIRRLALQSLVVVPIIAIGVIAQMQQNLVQQQLKQSFDSQVANVQKSIQDRALQYEHAATGAQALFAASDSVERGEWQRYVRALDLNQNYPDVRSVGYVQYAKNQAELDALQTAARRDGVSQFTVFPAGQRDQYMIVYYVDPLNATTSQTLGYDLLTDNQLSKAMQLAQNGNAPTISGKVVLLQEEKSSAAGFLMFVPVYQNGQSTNTLAQREQNITGFVYMPFNASRFFKDAANNKSNRIDLSVYDGTQTEGDKLLYSNATMPITQGSGVLSKTVTFFVGGHPWTLAAQATSDFQLSSAQERAPDLIFIGGSLAYFLAVLVLYSVQALRAQAVTLIESADKGPKKHGRA